MLHINTYTILLNNTITSLTRKAISWHQLIHYIIRIIQKCLTDATSTYCVILSLTLNEKKKFIAGILEVVEEDYGALLIIASLAALSFLICLLCIVCHCKKKRRHHRQLGLHRNAHYDSTTSATGWWRSPKSDNFFHHTDRFPIIIFNFNCTKKC